MTVQRVVNPVVFTSQKSKLITTDSGARIARLQQQIIVEDANRGNNFLFGWHLRREKRSQQQLVESSNIVNDEHAGEKLTDAMELYLKHRAIRLDAV